MGRRGWVSQECDHNLPDFGYVVQSLQTVPEYLRTWLTVTLSAQKATEYSYHSDGFPLAKEKYGAEGWMHPWIADVLRRSDKLDLPYLPAAPIIAPAPTEPGGPPGGMPPPASPPGGPPGGAPP